MGTRRVVYVDVETSGLNAWGSRIIEYGAVDDAGARFSRLVRQATPISRRIAELTGISNEMLVESGDTPEHAAREFLDFIGPAPALLCAHNAGFDALHIVLELRRVGLEPPPATWLDSMTAFQMTHPTAPRSRLADMARTVLGASGFVTSHRAADDARVVRDCLAALAPGGALELYERVEACSWPRDGAQ